MKIERIELRPVCYAARAEGAAQRRGFVVTLVCDDGRRGRGEALPLPSAGTETLDACALALRRARHAPQAPLDAVGEDTPAARCALDSALLELGLAELGAPPRRTVWVNAVAIRTTQRALDEAAHAIERHGYRTLKLKVGHGSAQEDVRWLRAVRQRVGPGVRLRIDANGAWNADEACHRLERLAEFELELCEQPVAARDLEGLLRVASRVAVPVAADESLVFEEARRALARGQLTRRGVLKPMVLGGPSRAASLARDATTRGVRCVVTTTFEGPIGTAASLELAARWGDPELAHGLAGFEQLDVDFPTRLRPRGGQLQVRGAYG